VQVLNDTAEVPKVIEKGLLRNASANKELGALGEASLETLLPWMREALNASDELVQAAIEFRVSDGV
jgi:hypothetical protein